MGKKGAQKKVEREVRARSRTWPAVKGCGNKSTARCDLTDTLGAISTPSLCSQERVLYPVGQPPRWRGSLNPRLHRAAVAGARAADEWEALGPAAPLPPRPSAEAC